MQTSPAATATAPEMQALNKAALKILHGNDRGDYTVPTHGLYPYQWNWDSAFAAMGFAQIDLDRAWREFETLFSGQWDNGMVPHILFHQVDPGYFPGPDIWGGHGPIPSSGISQPPVAATLIRRIWEMDKARSDRPLRALFPKLVAWHRWFMKWRCEDGMICASHPWESGRDNAPDWDGAMAAIDPAGVTPYERRDTTHVDPHMRPTRQDYDRYIWLVDLGRNCNWDEAELKATNPFRVADPALSFILLRANRDLAEMGQALGLDTSEITAWITLQEAGVQRLFNPAINAYDAFDLRQNRFAGSLSNASFLCWYGGLENPRMGQHFDRIMQAVSHGVPSHDPESPRFDRKRYWRGPSWAVMNTLIGIGLKDQGHDLRAELVRAHTRAAISKSGFAEYFDPLDGSPAGGEAFTWTAAVWLSWAAKDDGRV